MSPSSGQPSPRSPAPTVLQETMKLLVNLLAHGRYWKAGEEIPDSEVPAMLRKARYVMADPDPNADPQPIAPQRAPSHPQRENKARKPSKG
jgi:hypothetical protein